MIVANQRDVRIIIVDDHAVMRTGLRLVIESYPGMRVVAETMAWADTMQMVAQEQPDVILLDLDLGDESGLTYIPELRRIAPQSKIIVLTGLRDVAAHQEAVRLGAVGLVLKDQASAVLVQAIERVALGQAWLDPHLVANVLTELSRAYGAVEVDPELLKIAALTEREREVISLICEGLQNKVIGERLSISDTTVRHHLTSIFSKLGVENRLELVIYAYRNGLAKLP